MVDAVLSWGVERLCLAMLWYPDVVKGYIGHVFNENHRTVDGAEVVEES